MPQGSMFVDRFGAAPGGVNPPKTNEQSAKEFSSEADSFFARGQYADALRSLERAIALAPLEADYYWRTAMCLWTAGQFVEAGPFLQKAVELNPNFASAQSALGQWYLRQGIVDLALHASGRALELAPDNNGIIESHAWVLEAAGELDACWDLMEKLVARNYATASAACLFARMARRRARQADALAMIDRVLRAGGLTAEDRARLHFAAADLLDGMGRFDDAFANAAYANTYRPTPSDPTVHEKSVSRMIEYFTRAKIASLPKATERSAKPVFIVGMPRSGTSLVEQILASHPNVHGAGELDLVYRTLVGALDMLHAAEQDYPACISGLSLDQIDGLSQAYLQPLIALDPTARFIIDKMPLNFLNLGMISLLLPEARIIHCTRDPVDTCLSCFMTPLNGFDFKHDLRELGLFYRQYQRLMAHWKQVLDIRMIDVNYEELVSDAETQSRRLVDFLGLPWDDRCLRFNQTKRSVATSSVQQVRLPIYASSVSRRTHYDRHLAVLKSALGVS